MRVLSITQQTSNDPSGEMIRRIFSVFDEYQSKENGKHTLRAMRENARQGFFNGSRPPLGYRAVEVELPGNKGKKKRLEVDVPESVVVHRVFEMYLHGDRGRDLGVQGIAAHLNDQGLRLLDDNSTKNWFMADSKMLKKYNIFIDRIKPESKTNIDFNTLMTEISCYFRIGCGPLEWRSVYGHTVS